MLVPRLFRCWPELAVTTGKSGGGHPGFQSGAGTSTQVVLASARCARPTPFGRTCITKNSGLYPACLRCCKHQSDDDQNRPHETIAVPQLMVTRRSGLVHKSRENGESSLSGRILCGRTPLRPLISLSYSCSLLFQPAIVYSWQCKKRRNGAVYVQLSAWRRRGLNTRCCSQLLTISCPLCFKRSYLRLSTGFKSEHEKAQCRRDGR